MDNFSSRFFADASAAYADARYVIVGIPFDGTTSFRPGTRFGPAAIRDLSYNFESFHPRSGIDLAEIPVADLGDLDSGVVPDEMVAGVEASVRQIVSDGKVPVLLGGEHSLTIGAVKGVRPDTFVVCDAHLDLRHEFRGSTFSHACTTRRVYEDGISDIVIIGGRSGTSDQFEFAKTHCTLYTPEDILARGIDAILREVLSHVEGKRVYLSIDADVIDCCLTPGLGTPEPFGMTPEEIRGVIEVIAPHAVAFDYVEVCPPFDHGQAATVGAEMVREFLVAHWNSLRQ